MPKTPSNLNDTLASGKYKIGATRKVATVQTKAIAPHIQKASNSHFWLCVFTLICAHVAAPAF
jgi:hypothetical protein